MPFFIPRKRKVSVRTTWTRLEKWLQKNLPAAHRSLNHGATQRQIRDLEKATRRTLPDDLKESLLIHNGQKDVLEGVVFGLLLIPIDWILSDWELMRRVPEDGAASAEHGSTPIDAVQCCDNHPGWIPLTFDGSGSHLGVDLAPGVKGAWGQVINFGKSEYNHFAISASWGDFLADLMDELAAGNYSLVTEDHGRVIFNWKEPLNYHFCDALRTLHKERVTGNQPTRRPGSR